MRITLKLAAGMNDCKVSVTSTGGGIEIEVAKAPFPYQYFSGNPALLPGGPRVWGGSGTPPGAETRVIELQVSSGNTYTIS